MNSLPIGSLGAALLTFFFSVVIPSAHGANMDLNVKAKSGSTPPLASSTSVPSYKGYTYYGDRYRDPFIPLNGDIRSDQQALDRPPSVMSLVLKGIVQDAKGRMALLTSGANSYILRGGRLYNGRNLMVRKVAGVIKTDSVVIIGADRTVRELKTKAPL